MIKKTEKDAVQINHAAKPSWKRYGEGSVQMRLRNCTGTTNGNFPSPDFKPFIEVSIEESSHPEKPNGRYTSRYTYFGAKGEERDAIIDVVAPGYADLLKVCKLAAAKQDHMTVADLDVIVKAIQKAEVR
jgi:hypothetical protein